MKVDVLMPVYDQVAFATAHSLACLCLRSASRIGSVRMRQSSILTENRNALARGALAGDATHLLWIDSDMGFPPDTLERLLGHELPLVGVNGPRKIVPTDSTARTATGERVTPRPDGLERVGSIGMGIVLAAREVFEKVGAPWFKQVNTSDRSIGEDTYFSKAAEQAGFALWIDHGLSAEIEHVGRFSYRLSPVAREA